MFLLQILCSHWKGKEGLKVMFKFHTDHLVWPWAFIYLSYTMLHCLFTSIAASVSVLMSLLWATAVSFVCFSPSGFHGLCISGLLLMLLLGLGAPLCYLFEMLLPLAVCAIVASSLLSVYLYIRSFWAPSHALAAGGNTGESWGYSYCWCTVHFKV